MRGYWKDSRRTEHVLNHDSGWLNSADLGYQDADGYVYFLGRADDVISSGGINIHPDDVENCAMQYLRARRTKNY